jgi:hypothetical protein
VCDRYNLRTGKPEPEGLFGPLEDLVIAVEDHWPMRPGLVYRPREDRPERVMLRWVRYPSGRMTPKSAGR